MRALPNDFARCMNSSDCPLASRCRRTVPPPVDAYRTVGQYFPGGVNCEGFYPAETQGE